MQSRRQELLEAEMAQQGALVTQSTPVLRLLVSGVAHKVLTPPSRHVTISSRCMT